MILLDEPWSIEDFVEGLKSIPWFCNIGRSAAEDSECCRIHRWEEWPGPADPAVSDVHMRQQALFEDTMNAAGNHREELQALWHRIHAVVIAAAAATVPFDPQQDAWHAPTTAVWHAAWTAGLVALCRQCGRPIPADLQEQWTWFSRGHWPCGYVGEESTHVPRLLVF
jgi:hypothetical protein